MCKSNVVLGADPIIREVNKNDLNECLEGIHQSFSTVAEQFGLTKDNCPKHTSSLPRAVLPGSCLTASTTTSTAGQFGLTKENCPKHTSFIPLSFLETQMNWGWHMFALCSEEKIVGYMSLSKEDDGSFDIEYSSGNSETLNTLK